MYSPKSSLVQEFFLFIKVFFIALVLFILESSIFSFFALRPEFRTDFLLVLFVLLSLKKKTNLALLVFLLSYLFSSYFASGETSLLVFCSSLFLLLFLETRERTFFVNLAVLFMACFAFELVDFVYYVVFAKLTDLISGLRILLISPMINLLAGTLVSFLLELVIFSKKTVEKF